MYAAEWTVRNPDLAGVSRRVEMQMVGHKTASIYHRYRIVSDSDLSDAADRLNGRPLRRVCVRFP